MGKLNVDGTEIQVLQIEEDDYISLTDMVRKIDNGLALIEKLPFRNCVPRESQLINMRCMHQAYTL